MAGRLDAEQIETLRAWGAGLETDEREEVRAAGKAITLLVEEIDRLMVDLWNLRAGGSSAIEEAPPEAPSLGTTLRERLTRWSVREDT
jgi:hypothetical protein